ncbi:NUDIX domain-containing protein [Hysterangium stoloniferum]|nr:NUDIX domain-containing protein [Hysterangium stoloniferum]
MPGRYEHSVPRISSSLIVINDQNRVLMVERNPNSKSFAGAYVFPGGVLDAQQDTSNKLTAIRETFEETGVLLASPLGSSPIPSPETLNVARRSIHSQKIPFTTFLAQNGLTADVNVLLPFTQWITPNMVPRRFHAYFFVVFLPTKSSFDNTSQQGLQQLPTSDGGVEVISVRFLKPQDAITEFKNDKISLLPPQYYLLDTLASILSGDKTTLEQKNIVSRLANGPFGQMSINPVLLPEKDEEGCSALTYEGDEARGGDPGARHRTVVRHEKGEFRVVRVERNINIHSGIPLGFDTAKL